jgi:hypothetical protein
MKSFGGAFVLLMWALAAVGCSDSDDAGPGSSSDPNTVQGCYGDACPMGECDNSLFLADVPCSGVYTAPFGPNTVLCSAAAGDGSYCLDIGASEFTSAPWMVTCAAGQGTSQQCPVGCGVSGNLATCD